MIWLTLVLHNWVLITTRLATTVLSLFTWGGDRLHLNLWFLRFSWISKIICIGRSQHPMASSNSPPHSKRSHNVLRHLHRAHPQPLRSNSDPIPFNGPTTTITSTAIADDTFLSDSGPVKSLAVKSVGKDVVPEGQKAGWTSFIKVSGRNRAHEKEREEMKGGNSGLGRRCPLR